jgi:hypothetical protein
MLKIMMVKGDVRPSKKENDYYSQFKNIHANPLKLSTEGCGSPQAQVDNTVLAT